MNRTPSGGAKTRLPSLPILLMAAMTPCAAALRFIVDFAVSTYFLAGECVSGRLGALWLAVVYGWEHYGSPFVMPGSIFGSAFSVVKI